jgi:hypothetical protein
MLSVAPMIYLLGFVFWWVRDALLPALLVGGGSCVVWWLVGACCWHGRVRLRRTGMGVLFAAAVVWLAVATNAVWFRFHNPQFDMFRTYVADPIPESVRELVVDSGAPAMFYEGALLRFRAPAPVMQAILEHRLPGGSTVDQAARLATRLGRDAAVTARLSGPAGGYLRYDPVTFAPYDTREWAFVLNRLKQGTEHTTLRPPPTDHDIFVYAERGEWGTLACVATVARDSDVMTVAIQTAGSGRRR